MDYSRAGIKKKQRQLNSKGTKIKKMLGINLIKALLICGISMVIIGACLGVGMFKGILASTPDFSTIDVTPSGYATYLYDSEGHQLTKLIAENSNRTFVTMDKIPKCLADAVVAAEDERFYLHNGIDIKGIMRAAAIGIKNRHFSQGASTITQQLIKNNVFDNFVNEKGFDKYKRKVQEQYLAMELEKRMDKEQILELYMNTINLGHNTLGVQAASLRYFGKPVYELNLSEAVTIAGITQNPSANDPILHPDTNAGRRERVLNKMLELGFITKQEWDECMADDVYARITETNTTIEESDIYTYFEDAVIDSAAKDLTEKFLADGYSEVQASNKAYNLLYSGGLSIYTTQDPQIQGIVDEIYTDEENYPSNTRWYLNYRLSVEHVNGDVENYSTERFREFFRQENPKFNMIYSSQDDAYAAIQTFQDNMLAAGDNVIAESITLTPQPQVSLTVEDQTNGHILAMIGGRGTKESSRSLNRAYSTTRQPGSTFKVVSTYAPALDSAGITLADVFIDAPFNYSNGRPVSNWYGRNSYRGICSVRYGIEQSLNIIAVKTLTVITPQLGFDYLRDFGFTTLVDRRVTADGRVLSDNQQALALGGITDGVTNMELNAAYATIANKGVYMEPILYTRILDHDGNVLLDKTQIQDQHRVIKETTAFLLTDAMVDVVTKGTGTACNFGNMAIAGKTGTTSSYKDVWFAGYTPYYTATCWTGYDNNEDLTGDEKNLSKTMWKKVMSRLHENLEYKSFDIPNGIVTATVCRSSGLLPVAGLCDGDLRTEYFAEGTVPHESCNVHYAGNVCAASGLPADANCPFKMQGVLTLNPPEDPILQSSSGYIPSEGSCHHNEEFYQDPNYPAILLQEQAELEAKGLHFSLEGYEPSGVNTPQGQGVNTE
ncbi:MAG: transglycosylase domain-containing protein [Lachnospiraceae bacterium]|nr:transglycosylase domain-containing protein [Lachnospiraceae bacterium]